MLRPKLHKCYTAVGGDIYLKNLNIDYNTKGRAKVNITFEAHIDPAELDDFCDSINQLMQNYSERNSDINKLCNK